MSITATLSVDIPIAVNCTIASGSGVVGFLLGNATAAQAPSSVATWGTSDAATATAIISAINADTTGVGAMVSATSGGSGVITATWKTQQGQVLAPGGSTSSLVTAAQAAGSTNIAATGTGSSISAQSVTPTQIGNYVNGQAGVATLKVVNGDATVYSFGGISNKSTGILAANLSKFINGGPGGAALTIPASVTTSYAIPFVCAQGQVPNLVGSFAFDFPLLPAMTAVVSATAAALTITGVAAGTPGGLTPNETT